jgi:hypothetical protein
MSLAEELLADLGTPLSTIKRLSVWHCVNLKGLCHDMNIFWRLTMLTKSRQLLFSQKIKSLFRFKCQPFYLDRQCHEMDIFFWRKILISTFCLCADGFRGLLKALHFPIQLTFLFASLKLLTNLDHVIRTPQSTCVRGYMTSKSFIKAFRRVLCKPFLPTLSQVCQLQMT